MRRTWPLSAAVLLLALAAARADAPKRDHAITVDDYFTLDIILQSAISPDGKHVAFTLGRWQESTDDRKSDLWVVNTETKAVKRLTFARGNDSSPRWAPDGQTIYFLGRRKREGEKQPPRDGTAQVWRIGVGGGSPFPVTRVAGGVEAFDLSPDGKQLYYQVGVEKIDGEWKALKQRFKGVEYGHGVGKKSQIWRLDLTSWRAEKIIDEGRVVREFKVSPKGNAVAMITTPDQTVVSFEGKSRVDVFDLETKKATALPDKAYRSDAPSPYGWLENLAVSPAAGNAVAFNVAFDGYPAEIIVGGRRLPRPDGVQVKGYGSPLAWTARGDLLFLGEEHGRVRLYGTRPFEKSFQLLTPGDVVAEAVSVDARGERAAVVLNRTTHTPDLFLVDLRGGKPAEPTRLTNINPQVDTWKLPQISVVSWKGAKGDTVEGILELPPDYKPGKKVPLVACIHGGPTTADYYQLQFWIYGRTLLPAKGYAVLCPNYRGSTGYGDKFLTDLVGHENDLDVEDILDGVEAMVEKGIADPERLGVMGWSNGGYLTNCIITKTTRFKAASSGAGIVDAIMEWGGNDEPAYQMAFQGGFPWNRASAYHKASATYQLDRVRTPTLIHVGGNDERCPPFQSRMLHRTLKEYLKVPTELLVYPGESHGLMKYKNRKAKMEWDLAWFDRYLLGKKGK